MNKISIAIIGGDLRFVRLCEILADKNFDVWVYALNHKDIPANVNVAQSLEEVSGCNYIIGPVPFTRDNKTLFTPLSEEPVFIDEFVKSMTDAYLCLSALKDEVIILLERNNLKYIDLMEMNEIAIENAVPTAEGAIQYAMENSEITLNDSQVIVLGFGRCGKILAQKLKGLGANVAVEARKTTDLAYIKAYDYEPIPLRELQQNLHRFDFIFNTIPIHILDESCINACKKDTIYIELASAPGGIDLECCKNSNIKYVNAPSLPGKVAPKTAAKILYQGLEIIMKNQGELL